MRAAMARDTRLVTSVEVPCGPVDTTGGTLTTPSCFLSFIWFTLCRFASSDLHFGKRIFSTRTGHVVTQAAEITERSAERAELGNGGDLKIVVHRSESFGAGEKLEASPLDVSSSGMKLSTTSALVFAEPIELHFQSKALDIGLGMEAEVRWIRRGSDEETWHVGCAFATQLSTKSLDQLAIAGDVERRQWPRNNTETQATIRLACNQSGFEATLLDYSAAGLSFSSTENIEQSQPIKIQISDEDGVLIEITAKCRWTMAFESGYLIGCEVGGQHRNDFETWGSGLSPANPIASPTRKRLGIVGGILFLSLLTLYWLMSG